MAVSDLAEMLRSLEPVVSPGTYVFATVADGQQLPLSSIVASIVEPEGLSVVVEESAARRAGLTPAFHCVWITLSVNSDLQAVGLTAAFATALSNAGVSCNVVAGVHHDHIFVPVAQKSVALQALRTLQAMNTR
jgi:hypothetical protein